MKKILVINIILLLFVFLISEITSYCILLGRYKEALENFNIITENKTVIPLNYKKTTLETKKDLLSSFRPIEERNTKKRPIILFGCSYTEGFGLKDKQTFSYKLANYTNRTIINRGKSGTGLNFLYLQLSEEEIRKTLPKNPEYIIYTLIPDHFARLYRYRAFILGDLSLRYKIKNNKLVQDKPIFINPHSLFTILLLEEYIEQTKYKNDFENFTLFNKVMDESYKLIKEHYPYTKFVILYYEGPHDINNEILDETLKKYIKQNEDIILIEVNKELPEIQKNREYWQIDEEHPSSQAWNLIVPMVAKKLNINPVHH